MVTASGSKVAGALPHRSRRPRAGERNRGAVDAVQTKIAVDLQNLDPYQYQDQLRNNISELPEATGCDVAFLALFSDDGSSIETVLASGSIFSGCNPEVLTGESLEDWPWLTKRLGYLRLIEIDDTEAGPRSAAAEMRRLAELKIGSCLIIGFAVQGEIAGFVALANARGLETWDANLHLLMKLVGASLASGLERLRTAELLDELEERNDLVSQTANDGIWDFDGQSKRIALSRRWKAMLGYDEDEEDVMPDWYRLVHPDDMARVQAKMREHLEGKSQFFESVHRM
ncbi:MAG: PAS domain-containing protein, partial [Woeseiaceae bacterium]